VIILTTWFYITGFIHLMGGEVNAILEQCSSEGKAKRAPGAMPIGAANSAATAARSAAAAESPR